MSDMSSGVNRNVGGQTKTIAGGVDARDSLGKELSTGLFTPLDGVKDHALDGRMTKNELVGVGEDVGDDTKDCSTPNVLRKHVVRS